MTQTALKVVINDVEFEEIADSHFRIYGEENKFPFLLNAYTILPNACRVYKSIVINEKYYAPIIK